MNGLVNGFERERFEDWDKEVCGRGIWMDIGNWASSVKIVGYYDNVCEIVFIEEEIVNN